MLEERPVANRSGDTPTLNMITLGNSNLRKNANTNRFHRTAAATFASLILGACIATGPSEPGYFRSVVDQSDLSHTPGRDGLRLSTAEFYAAHRKSVVSEDRTSRMLINYVDSGDASKPAVLFVHGTPGGWENFVAYLVMAELKDNAHLVSVDRPGWGDSTCVTEDGKTCFYPLLKQQAKHLGALVKRLDQQNNHQGVILVGHSWGGPLIGQMALDYPEIIKGLIFVAAPFDPELSHPRWYNRLSSLFALIVPDDLRKANDEMLPLTRQLDQMKDQWASINLPIWVIQGMRDDLVNPKNLDFSKKVFLGQDAQFRAVEENGHFVVWEKKSIVVDCINQALASLARRN